MTQPTTAIILCAGRGTRMGALTETHPKPLLPLSTGESLLEVKLHALPENIKKLILIIGYKGEMIREAIGTTYEGMDVTYVEQDIETAYGTGAALALCKEHVKGESVLVLMGDDIYAKEDLAKLCTYENAVLLDHKGEEKMLASWQVGIDGDRVTAFYQNVPEEHLRTGIINTAAYVLSPSYFDIEPEIGGDGEVQIPPTIIKMIEKGIVVNAVKATYWKQVTAPEDLVL